MVSGIPPASRGVGKLIVCFDLDIDDISNVSVTEKTTGVKGRSLLPMISGDCPMKRLREWSSRQRVTRLKMMIT